jgi:hypothetical protein
MNGTNGATGAQGPQGIQGVAGIEGPQGPPGSTTVVEAGPTECSAPNGTYSVVWTTVSGNCGTVTGAPVVFGSGSSILSIGYSMEVSPTGANCTQDGNDVAANECSGAVSSSCTANSTVSPFDFIQYYTVVNITSNTAGTQFTGNVSFQETDESTSTILCTGTYSVVRTVE